MTPFRLRALAASDLASAQLLSAASGWPHRVEDWRLFHALGRGIAAIAADGTLAGTAMWWECGTAAATVGMILVAPPAQGRGIGRLMMQHVLGALGERALMLNSTEAGLRLYETLGFRAIGAVGQHQGDAVPQPGAAARPLAAELQREAIALDAAAFGASRAPLLARLLADAESAAIDGETGLAGFALRRRFGRGHVIGPVVAADEDAAIRLVAQLLRPGFTRIDIPADAARLAAYLASSGMPPVSAATVMVRGPWPAPAAGARRFGLVSQAQG